MTGHYLGSKNPLFKNYLALTVDRHTHINMRNYNFYVTHPIAFFTHEQWQQI